MNHSRPKQHELLFGEFGIDQRQRHAVKRQIPGGEPGEFPFVGHRHDFAALEMTPVMVAAVLALRRRRRLQFVAAQPAGHVVVIELLGPDQAGEGLPLHAAGIGVVQCRAASAP